jgi:NAD(P)H-hydrate epimerase
LYFCFRTGAPILSVDVPSGVDATTGKPSGDFIRANTTMAVALPKTGLTKEKSGLLYLADVGIPASIYKDAGITNYTNPFGEQFIIRLQQQ